MSNDTLPTTMKYINIKTPGGAELLELSETDLPTIDPNEILIKVAAAGVNRPDILQRRGLYPPPPCASPILGLEVAGTVAALGSQVLGWQIGDKICALTNGGGYAEYVAVDAHQCLPVPSTLSLPEAAAVPETFFTVWANLFLDNALKRGQTLLVHGGSGGIGSTAIQVAEAFGIEVFATAGNKAKQDFCRALGASHAIDYSEDDFAEIVMRQTKSQGVNAILDMVGGDYFQKHLAIAANDARIISIAFLKGSKMAVDLLPIMLKRLIVTGSTLRPRSTEFKARIAKDLLEKIWPLFEARKLMVPIDSVYRLKDATLAHQRLESNQHMGKIILIV